MLALLPLVCVCRGVGGGGGGAGLRSAEKSVPSAHVMGWGADNVIIGESCGQGVLWTPSLGLPSLHPFLGFSAVVNPRISLNSSPSIKRLCVLLFGPMPFYGLRGHCIRN